MNRFLCLVALLAVAASTGVGTAPCRAQGLAGSSASVGAPLIDVYGTTMVRLDSLADWILAETLFDPDTGRITVRRSGAVLSAVLNSHTAVVNRRACRLSTAPLFRNGAPYLPLQEVAAAIGVEIAFDVPGLHPKEIWTTDTRTGAVWQATLYGRAALVPPPPPGPRRLFGYNRLRVSNGGDSDVDVEVESGDRRVRFHVRTGEARTVGLPNGVFDIFFVFADRPAERYQGDSFTLRGRSMELRLGTATRGNYSLRRVR